MKSHRNTHETMAPNHLVFRFEKVPCKGSVIAQSQLSGRPCT